MESQVTVDETKSTPAKAYTAPRKEIWGWALGRVAEYGLIAPLGIASNVFTIGLGLDPRIVGWVMMLPRLLDGLVDPVVGHWSDNTHTRWGRRKPFMLGGALIGAFFVSLLWWVEPHWSNTQQFAFLLVIACCLYFCYGAFAMAWNAIGYELSDDYHERSGVAAIGGFILALVVLGNPYVWYLAQRDIFGSVLWGMRWLGGGISILIVTFAIITCMMTRERFANVNKKREHVRLLPAVRETLKNRPFVILLAMKVFEIFGGRLTGGLAGALGAYYICRGDQKLFTALTLIGANLGFVWNFVALPFVKPTSRLMGKRGAMILAQALGFATAIAAPFMTTPEHPYWSIIPGLVVAPLLVITGTIAGAVLPDICDVDELAHGERREGLFTSVMGFVGKLEISLASVLSMYIITWASIDTSIVKRWDAMIDQKPDGVAGFVAGETAVYRTKDSIAFSFDTVEVTIPADGNAPKSIELLAGDQSPTEAFVPVARVDLPAGAMGKQTLQLPSTTARFVMLKLGDGSNSAKPIDLAEIHLVDSQSPTTQPSAFAVADGIKLAAARPPEALLNRFYWIVLLPAIGFTGITLLITVFFPLTEAKMVEVRRQLDERHRMQKLTIDTQPPNG